MIDKRNLGKLLKHSLKETWKGVLIADICLFGAYILEGLLVLFLGDALFESAAAIVIFGIVVMTVGIVNLGAFALLIYYLFKTINQKLFTNEGYLTFTLPVNVDELILSRIITNLIYIISVFVVSILGSLFVNIMASIKDIMAAALSGNSIINYGEMVPTSNVNPLYYIGNYFESFLNIIYYLTAFIMSLAIINSSSSSKNRTFLAFVLFIGIAIGTSVIQSLLSLMSFGIGINSANAIKFGFGYKNDIVAYAFDIPNLVLLIGLIIGFYIITRKLLSKRLELL